MFPFTAVVGADDVKQALLLAALDPGIGGVLLRGEKGSAKTTLARGLASLLPGAAPFVDLPIGTTEDRLIGSIDLTAALTEAEIRFRPGLLAAANGGVLYVDEVNLLPDHLVDVLLDVAASGINRVEREGVQTSHPARFVLVGSMNPEEGELRPQFLDRFGLAVDVMTPADPVIRAEAVARRLAFDLSPDEIAAGWAMAEDNLRQHLDLALALGPAQLPRDLLESITALCAAVGVDGLRADLVISRAAAALARWNGHDTAGPDDVRRVAGWALAHRARRNPLDQHGMDDQRLQSALDAAFAPPDPGSPTPERVAEPDETQRVMRLEAPPFRASAPAAPGRRSLGDGDRGRLVAERIPGPGTLGAIAVGGTIREAVTRRAQDPDGPPVVPADLREAVREQRVGNLIIIAVDASASMSTDRRMEAAKGAVLALLVDAYQRRDRVTLVTFRDQEASVVLQATGSVEVARARLTDLPTGGRTPLSAGILAAIAAADRGAASGHRPLIVLVTDGRATSAPAGQDPVHSARAAADIVRQRAIPAVVVDVEEGPTRLGLAGDLAHAMGARTITLDELTGERLATAVRSSL